LRRRRTRLRSFNGGGWMGEMGWMGGQEVHWLVAARSWVEQWAADERALDIRAKPPRLYRYHWLEYIPRAVIPFPSSFSAITGSVAHPTRWAILGIRTRRLCSSMPGEASPVSFRPGSEKYGGACFFLGLKFIRPGIYMRLQGAGGDGKPVWCLTRVSLPERDAHSMPASETVHGSPSRSRSRTLSCLFAREGRTGPSTQIQA